MAATATHHDHPGHHEAAIPQHAVDVAPVRLYSLIAVVVGLGVYLVAGFINFYAEANEHGIREFILSYACGFVFWSSLPFGSLALMMIGYVCGSSWGVVLRRIFQASIRTLPVLFVLGLPLIASLYVGHGKDSPYWWANDEWMHATESQKAGMKGFDEKVAKLEKPAWTKASRKSPSSSRCGRKPSKRTSTRSTTTSASTPARPSASPAATSSTSASSD